MLQFTTDDAVTVLTKAANLNSALKNFLKREIKPGDPAGRVVKDLKDLSSPSHSKQLADYLGRSRPAFDGHILAIGKYAHADAVNGIVGTIIDRYAEEFNSTYETQDESIKVTNEKRFKQIVDEAIALIETQQSAAGFGNSKYFKSLVLLSVFDRPVLDHISSLLN